MFNQLHNRLNNQPHYLRFHTNLLNHQLKNQIQMTLSPQISLDTLISSIFPGTIAMALRPPYLVFIDYYLWCFFKLNRLYVSFPLYSGTSTNVCLNYDSTQGQWFKFQMAEGESYVCIIGDFVSKYNFLFHFLIRWLFHPPSDSLFDSDLRTRESGR